MTLMRGQSDISAQVPMPTDRVDDASTVSTSTAETVVWSYLNAGAWASATGQAAGTICISKLAFTGVLNSINSSLGSANDTSLALGAATRFDALVAIPEDVLAQLIFMAPTAQIALITPFLSVNGYFAIDHRRGVLYGKAKAQVANDTATYDYMAPITGGSGPSSNVNVSQVGGQTTQQGAVTPTATLTGVQNVLPEAIYNATPTTRTEGQGGPLQANTQGSLKVDQGTRGAGEDLFNDVLKVEEQFSGTNITLAAPTTTVIKSGAGFLHCIQINKALANGVITIYDNTAASGTLIATITQPAAVLATTQNLLYDRLFTTGLTIVTSGAAQDVTCTWR